MKRNWDDAEFVDCFNRVAAMIHSLGLEQGISCRSIPEYVAHCMSELGEGYECGRMGNPSDKNIQDMSGMSVQFADALGTLMAMSHEYSLDMGSALLKKMKFNEARGWMHGKVF